MSTIFHNVFPDSFQGKYFIQNDWRLNVLIIHVHNTSDICNRLSGCGGVRGSQFQSPQLELQLGFGLFILLRKSFADRPGRQKVSSRV